ncbi:MAG: asparagine synthase (glutamine-hydrolyzing) [Calditrichaeota bacterium]|nr:asparagine synthase (glutamine-hydrolyzing) [Calditrichota bacterium]HQU73287.1 asparagine synthase (glutamine-hydrolyzing) [Calditrichia bacterium]
MCGIAGFFHFQPREDDFEPLVTRMIDQVVYRGPDAGATYTDEQVALGHRRLSIIDLSSGAHQPMSNKDGSVWIVFNGEIYNFLEVRKEFEAENYPFKTRSDTEVLIALYEKYGTNMLEKINGMYAFAIYDKRNKQMFIARDRIGKKPLYYYRDSERLMFASEMKSILADTTVPREIEPTSVDLYFSFIFVPAPYTMLKNIYKLLPGHYMVVNPDGMQIHRYWDVEYNPITDLENRSKYEDELYDLIYKAVQRRLISDVPLGAFLSGGVDSSSVVGMMSIVNEIPVKTFTIGYEEADYSEAPDARFIAEHFKTIHEELTVKPASVDIFPELVWHFDEPFGDASAVATYYVSKMARDYVTVVLSGDGGDELFAGYRRYQRSGQLDKYRRIPEWSRKLLLSPVANALPLNFPGRNLAVDIASDPDGWKNLGVYPYIKNQLYSSDMRHKLRNFEISFDLFPQLRQLDGLHPLSQQQYLDFKLYLPDDIMVKVDKMSMACSLETRAPLLDYTIAEFSAKLPPEWQLEGSNGKAFLKKVLQRYVPERVFTKPKQGFDIPKRHWFKNELKSYTRDILLSDSARQRGYLKFDLVEKILNDHEQGTRDYQVWIWNLLNFELWHRTFMDPATRRI